MEPYFPMSDRRAPLPRRRWPWVVAGALAAALLVAGLFPIVAGRTDRPVYARTVAEQAVSRARGSGASRWAEPELGSAEAALRTAKAEYRLQEVKLLPFRDFRKARAAFSLVEDKAHAATDAADRNRTTARAAAEEALAKAEGEGRMSSAFGDALHLAPYERKLLQKSKIALTEARLLFEREEFEAAASRAREAASDSQKVSAEAVTAAVRFTDPGLVRNWRRSVDRAIDWSRRTGGAAIVVLKEERRLDLYDGGRLVRSYPADMGYRSFSDKLRAGDAATPEGRYQITSKRGPGSAAYYKALDLDYPNDEDRAQFAALKRSGRIPRGASLGGSIQIHGEGGRGRDWTRGCVALSNRDIDDLFRRVSVGTPVTIVGGIGKGIYAQLARQHASTTTSGTR